jgi:hypothetical protein
LDNCRQEHGQNNGQACARIALWNIAWRRPDSSAGKTILKLIIDQNPDIICITEGYENFLPSSGHTITSDSDYGYPIKEGRRKVVLWSKNPWSYVDPIGDATLPSGRFVRGITETPIGLLDMIGVCIPWKEAHVKTGRKDRGPWEDHLTYLQGLKNILQWQKSEHTILLGDFNQHLPRIKQPKLVHYALMSTIPEGFGIATAGEIKCAHSPSIDHVCHSRSLECKDLLVLPQYDEFGARLSDHYGLIFNVESSR